MVNFSRIVYNIPVKIASLAKYLPFKDNRKVDFQHDKSLIKKKNLQKINFMHKIMPRSISKLDLDNLCCKLTV